MGRWHKLEQEDIEHIAKLFGEEISNPLARLSWKESAGKEDRFTRAGMRYVNMEKRR